VASYTTGQVERLLALPASTLRYWEREFSLLEPRKDAFGRRSYSEADLRMLLRLRHLAIRRGLGFSAATRVLVAELGGPGPESRARVAEIRGEPISLYFASVESRKRLERRGASVKGKAQQTEREIGK
jgi:DNA-binding transcriptional MerR regulator